MKIDWNKAKTIAAHRFEDIITACNRQDEDDLHFYMESGLAIPEEYALEDSDSSKDKSKRYNMIERIVDWQKAINLAAKRFGDIITACNEADSEALKALVTSGLGTEEDYTSSPENILKLDEKGCFIYKGFVCQICDCYELHKSADEGATFYVCRVAVHTAIEKRLKWIIVPYILYKLPSDSYIDKCTGLLSAIDEVTVGMEPELYEEIKKYELV